MEEILALLTSDPDKAIAQLKSQGKNVADITNYRLEYQELKRDIRDTQIATTQKDKVIPAKGDRPATTVTAVRIPIPFQKKIVRTATAFEVGERVILTPKPPGSLSAEILRLWNINRIDNKLQKLIETMKSETEAALSFYIEDVNPETQFNRVSGPNKIKEIRCNVLTSKGGVMAPFFDEYGDMKAFVWTFSAKKGDKEIKYTWVFTETIIYKYSDETSATVLVSSSPHGFSKIPVVYFSQDHPEWFDVQEMIDRIETSVSKLGASNDYSGHPLLKLYGEVKSMPGKQDDGKTLRFDAKETKDGKVTHGDAEFLTNSNAPESVKLELDRLEDLIYSLTSTPKLASNDLQGLGAISGIAIKLMFLDAIIKAKLNEGENRTSVERIINVLISGVVTTTVVAFKSQALDLIFDVIFQSIIPNDIKEIVDYLSTAKTAGFVSTKTGVEKLGLVEDVEAELALIAADKPAVEPIAATHPPTPAPATE